MNEERRGEGGELGWNRFKWSSFISGAISNFFSNNVVVDTDLWLVVQSWWELRQ